MSNLPGQEVRSQTELPEWLTAELPVHLPHTAISYEDDRFRVSHDGRDFPTIGEAYSYANSFASEYQTVFDDSVDGQDGDLLEGAFLDSITHSILISITTESMEESLRDTYRNWVLLALEYNLRPNDFLVSYHWLQSHPAFWLRRTNQKTFEWVTHQGLSAFTQSVYKHPDEDLQFMFEGGAHIKNDYTKCSGDSRVTAVAGTYEQAIISLAAKVNEIFDIKGNERFS